MKKIIIVVLAVAIAALAGSCSLFTQPMLAYNWSTTPTAFYDDNPSVPYTIYNGDYFATDESTYYMEYTVSGYSWWMYYTIAKKGNFFSASTTYFDIWLYYTGPEFTYYLGNRVGNHDSQPAAVETAPSGMTKGPRLGTIDLDRDGYTLHAEYGRLQ
jgi:hypothetical protein